MSTLPSDVQYIDMPSMTSIVMLSIILVWAAAAPTAYMDCTTDDLLALWNAGLKVRAGIVLVVSIRLQDLLHCTAATVQQLMC